MVFAARLTQRGHEIRSMDDLMVLYEKSFSEGTLRAISGLPHPTVQKFAVITVAVVGASRRFLAQITRHQNEVKFMSASLQYSDYSGQAEFAMPYSASSAMRSCMTSPKSAVKEKMKYSKTAGSASIGSASSEKGKPISP